MRPPSIVRFCRLIQEVRPPQCADRAALGTIATRAYRYCDALTSAASYGWHLFLPMDIKIHWDGSSIYWRYDGAPGWLPLQRAAQFPGQSARFDHAAPASAKGYSPPFLTATPDTGGLQIWTGFMARTAPGWSLLVRAPANLPAPGGYDLFEGIVETDRWFGALFTNIRLKAGQVYLHADMPFVQIQPLPQVAYAEHTLKSKEFVPTIEEFTAEDWAGYHESIVVPNQDPNRPPGAYAAAVRRRRRQSCPSSVLSAGYQRSGSSTPTSQLFSAGR
jgi:uncharacterized protein DUF6065